MKVAAAVISAIVVALALTSPFIIATVVARDGRPVVVVDAGHGGEDGGVTGTRTGVKESHLNLQMAKLLAECLKGGGYRVVMTRQNDTMHTFPSVRDNKKRADMFKRGEIINSVKPSAVISVHMNFYSASSRRGAQVFFDRRDEGGREFATIMQDALNRDINTLGGGRKYSALSAEKYLLSCSPYPSIIVECGFLSNPFDEANLIDPDYQAMLAQTLYTGIDVFLKSKTDS